MPGPVSSLTLEGWRTDIHRIRPLQCATCAGRPFTSGDHRVPLTNESVIAALQAEGEFRVLRRMEPQAQYADAEGAPTHSALYVDVETTGLDHAKDGIIQLAILPFTFTADGRVCEAGPSESWLEDPGVPINAAITTLTGIRQEDVAGQRIDDNRVHEMLGVAALVIAHNAAFDRPFLERRFPAMAGVPWGCSMADVPWIAEGLPSTKLEWLCERHTRVFYDAHRADADTIAGVHLLASTLPSGRPAMAALLASVRQRSLRIWALGAPYATKAALKARGYRWSGGEDGLPKAWWRDVPEDGLVAEHAWLVHTVYAGDACRAQVQRIGPKVRYSVRVGALRMDPLSDLTSA